MQLKLKGAAKLRSYILLSTYVQSLKAVWLFSAQIKEKGGQVAAATTVGLHSFEYAAHAAVRV